MKKFNKRNYISILLATCLAILSNNALAKAVPKSEPTQCIYPGTLGKTTLYNNSYAVLKSDPNTPIEMCEF